MDEERLITSAEIALLLFNSFSEHRPVEAALFRTVRYLAGQDVLRAIGGPRTGRGKERLYRREEILRAAILYQLAQFDVSIGSMKLMMKEVDAEIAAVCPGKDIIYLVDYADANQPYFTWCTWGYPDTYRLAFSRRNPAPPIGRYPRLSVDARFWRSLLPL